MKRRGVAWRRLVTPARKNGPCPLRAPWAQLGSCKASTSISPRHRLRSRRIGSASRAPLPLPLLGPPPLLAEVAPQAPLLAEVAPQAPLPLRTEGEVALARPPLLAGVVSWSLDVKEEAPAPARPPLLKEVESWSLDVKEETPAPAPPPLLAEVESWSLDVTEEAPLLLSGQAM